MLMCVAQLVCATYQPIGLTNMVTDCPDRFKYDPTGCYLV